AGFGRYARVAGAGRTLLRLGRRKGGTRATARYRDRSELRGGLLLARPRPRHPAAPGRRAPLHAPGGRTGAAVGERADERRMELRELPPFRGGDPRVPPSPAHRPECPLSALGDRTELPARGRTREGDRV